MEQIACQGFRILSLVENVLQRVLLRGAQKLLRVMSIWSYVEFYVWVSEILSRCASGIWKNQLRNRSMPTHKTTPTPLWTMAKPPVAIPTRLFSSSHDVNTIATHINVPAAALFCVELMAGIKCSIEECPYPAAERNSRGHPSSQRSHDDDPADMKHYQSGATTEQHCPLEEIPATQQSRIEGASNAMK